MKIGMIEIIWLEYPYRPRWRFHMNRRRDHVVTMMGSLGRGIEHQHTALETYIIWWRLWIHWRRPWHRVDRIRRDRLYGFMA